MLHLYRAHSNCRRGVDELHADTAGQIVDHRDRHQDHQNDESGFVPVADADAVGELEADAAGSDNAQDRRRAHVALEEIEDVAEHDWENLRKYAQP